MGPGRPSPIRRPSIFTTGVSCVRCQWAERMKEWRMVRGRARARAKKGKGGGGGSSGFGLNVIFFDMVCSREHAWRCMRPRGARALNKCYACPDNVRCIKRGVRILALGWSG